MLDKILDTAGQKGTGKWTAISALDLGQPVTLIGESVFARLPERLERRAREGEQGADRTEGHEDRRRQGGFYEQVRCALYCSKMISYAQGYMLLRGR